MDGWTIIVLPELTGAAAMLRSLEVADWVDERGFSPYDIGISDKIVRFRKESEAIMFKLSFVPCKTTQK